MKKLFVVTSAVLLTASLFSCSGAAVSSSAPVASDSESSSTSFVEEASLKLPTISGLKFDVNNENPSLGDFVEITVTNLKPSEKRVDALTVNGEVLTARESNGNVKKYAFTMQHEVANVDVVAVDIYAISVAEDVSDKFAIFGIEGNVAGVGDVVEFAPGSYAGYYFYGVSAVEEDVVISPIEDRPGWFSFVMPAHDVTLTSTVGTNFYQLSFSENVVKLYGEEREYYSLSGVKDGKYYAYGEELTFRVYDQESSSYNVSSLTMNGVDLVADEYGYYTFNMPAYDAHIEVNYTPIYRTLVLGEVDLDYTATMKVVVDGVEEDISASNVISGREVRVYTTTTLEDPHYSPKFTFETRTAAQTDEEYSSETVEVTYDEEGGYYKFYAPKKEVIRLNVSKKFGLTATDSAVGHYEGGYRGYYSGNYELTVGADSVITYNKTGSSGTVKELTFPDVSNTNYATFTSGSYQGKVFFGEDAVMLFDASARGGVYLFAKGKGASAFSSSNSAPVYSYYRNESGTLVETFVHMEMADGSVVTAYYNLADNTVVFNAVETFVSGSVGTKDSKVAITHPETGDTLAYYTVSSISGQSDGYQHPVVAAELDGKQGTYSAEGEEAGTLVITGYGKARYNGVEYDYSEYYGTYHLVNAEGELYVTLNIEAHTYAVVAKPLDGYQGTYTGANGDLVLDGYGNATYNGETGTYTASGTSVTVVINGEALSFALGDGTYETAALYEISFDSTYTFVENADGHLVSNNQGKGSSDAKIVITAKADIEISFDFLVSSEASWDYFFYSLNGTPSWNRSEPHKSGNGNTGTVTITIHAGDILELIYHKDNSGNSYDDQTTITRLVIGSDVIVG